ncbi:MAG: outer membrane lipid asymmetry maintenance protein MlaD [Salinisphaera sp.]|nr:outer membrane lipid asymmetry maintenance protein MlaD [Salinisphaera sp.]
MQSRSLEILVGFFVCLGIAAVFVLTMRVSNLSDVSGFEGYTVHAAFFNIGGLKAGAPVKLGGVQIGRVQDIHLDPQTYQAVVAMKIKDEYKLPRDSDASILTAGLLGAQYLGIGPGGSMEYLQDGGEIKITQSAIVLEQIIGQVLYSLTSDKKSGSGKVAPAPAAPSFSPDSAPEP